MIVYWIITFSTFIGLIFSYFNILVLLTKKRSKKDLKEFPKVSIIVPAYNEEENIGKTIESLVNLDYPKEKLEIIVIDDGSTDRTYEIAKRFEEKYPRLVKVYRKKNGGKASTLNFGIKKASGEFIATMDADSIVPKNALKEMLRYFVDDKVMIVVPAIQVTRTETIIEKIQYIEYTYNNTLREIFDALDSIYVAPGPFSIFRRKLFDIIGYFDENNLTEDMEIALRAQNYGFKIRYAPEVIVRTKAPKSFKALLRQRIRWYLGFVENYIKYRNIRNELLKEVVFASAWIFIVIPILLFFVTIYYQLRSFINTFDYLKAIKYDIIPEILYNIRHLSINLDILRTSYAASGFWIIFLGILMQIIFIILVFYAWRYERNRNIKALIIYSYLYSIVYAIFWLEVFYYKIFGKEVKWGGVTWRNSLINRLRNKI